MPRNTRGRGEQPRVELKLECTECEETHSHIFYEPAPDSTVVECPTCGKPQEHDVVGRL